MKERSKILRLDQVADPPDGVGRRHRGLQPSPPESAGPGLLYGVQYSRVANSDLIDKLEFMWGSTTSLARADYTHEANRDLVTVVDNRGGLSPGTTFSKYDYGQGNGYDALGRRTSVVYTGTSFASDHHADFGYNDRSELTAADRKTGTTPGQGTPMTPGDFDYAYDNIGNRESHTLDSSTRYYCSSDLNQYMYLDDEDETCPEPATPTDSFDHDDDGNLDDDGTYEYTWDCENRLIRVAPASSPVEDDKKLEFKYDYMGRRVEKVYSVYDVPDQTPDAWVVTSTERFVYEGWNVVLVLDDNNDTLRKYTWGLDLSGTVHGAGGIGGLLACEETENSEHEGDYWFFYDANGNVGQVLNISTPGLAAHYEYDPYGNVIAMDDPDENGYDEVNPFRFSTKWLDTELAASSQTGAIGEDGLSYYGYRYYSPRLGRWLNRDPIGERGGPNLYAFVRGDPINGIDPHGNVSNLPTFPGEGALIRVSHKQHVISVLSAKHRELFDYHWYALFGGQEAVLRSLTALRKIPFSRWQVSGLFQTNGFFFFPGGYYYIVIRSDASWSTVFHEGVHAHHYFFHRSIADDMKKDEGIAHVSTLVLKGGYSFTILENALAGRDPTMSPRTLKVWQVGWDAMNEIIGWDGTKDEYDGLVLGVADFARAKQTLGLAVSCPKLAKTYNELVKKMPFPYHCYRFLCKPGCTTPDGEYVPKKFRVETNAHDLFMKEY